MEGSLQVPRGGHVGTSWDEYNGTIARCTRCVMPHVPGHVGLDEAGVCSCCRAAEARGASRQLEAAAGSESSKHARARSFQSKTSEEREAIFRAKVARFRSDGPYDCAVAVSGGKDSLGAWYLARKLGLKTLAIFIDNGFALPEMYDNIHRAADVLGSDVMVYRTNDLKALFNVLLLSKRPIYYCHVCHMLLDNCVKRVAKNNGIRLVLGGYTKGQSYLSQDELKWIFEVTDRNLAEVLEGNDELGDVARQVTDPFRYAMENYRDIMEISPFKYLDYDEDELVALVREKLGFTAPLESWPAGSTNCLFNYVSQYLAVKQFGYSQHETELSDLVRLGEMSREAALRTICTPIPDEELAHALAPLDPRLTVEFVTSQMESVRGPGEPVLGAWA